MTDPAMYTFTQPARLGRTRSRKPSKRRAHPIDQRPRWRRPRRANGKPFAHDGTRRRDGACGWCHRSMTAGHSPECAFAKETP